MQFQYNLELGFTFKHHEDNSVEGLASDLGAINTGTPALDAGLTAAKAQQTVVDTLLATVKDMNDGFDEYIISLSGSYQLTDTTQITLYGEYTFDDAHQMSQNGTDVKAEIGARVNVVF